MAIVENTDNSNFDENRKYETDVKLYNRWEEYNLDPNLLKGIYAIGFETPSFIQKAAIKPIIDGCDIRAQAQSGTGKTGAFAIGALQSLDLQLNAPQVLVLVNTREVAAQNANRFMDFSKFMHVNVCLLAGGTPVQNDIRHLSSNPQVIVGTPGRVEQMIHEEHLKTEHIKLFIIDEADEMLQAGFMEQVKNIFMALNRKKIQIAMFSATYEEEELAVSEEILNNPVIIDLRQSEQTLIGIKQFLINLGRDNSPRKNDINTKLLTLVDLFKRHKFGQTVIFVTAKVSANYIYEGLNAEGIPCEVITADKVQTEREEVLERFRSGKNRILVSSGLLSRGIDIQDLSVVFCLDVPPPNKKSTYIHRIGRSGRYGKKGIAILLLHEHELPNLKEIEKFYNTKVKDFTLEDLGKN
ncbi:ATP-dependent RNA helicase eIF4A [Nosema bombycis CQ1]|uniref:RNA helicase n=1 Tax=Nosema bombycis (strain CQ1 / CVCC 102059) TaxID=578461 RepID=R0MMF6_NOSB1|nr:ATP-dependent RNA helicase eIF4A [Nosema bombycis CQ1]|eukprot:EOB14043.1 ATP-dependent RNA helicase eIF4A [Nosema bombycis CQ1]